MGWVFHHEAGKRHKTALGNKVPTEEHFPNPPEPEEPILQVAPGEPVPPGFEGQVEKVSLIQERLDAFNVGPLVALEYLLELRDYDVTKEPNYLCVLCDKKGDPRTVLTHLASYKHILQYLQKHFPTCYRALAPYMTKQYKRNWQQALHEVAEAIEKRFGRLRPMPIEADKFEKDQDYYLELIAKGRHFSELSGFTFESLINKEELTKVHEDESDKFALQRPIAGASTQPPKKKSPSPPFVQNPIKKVKASSGAAMASTTAATAAASTNATSSTAVGTRRRSLSSVSSITSSDLSDYDDTKDRRPQRRRSKSPYSRRRSKSPYARRRSPPTVTRRDYYRRDERRSRSRSRERGLMPWERSNYKRSSYSMDNRQKNKNDKLEEYKKLCKAIDNDMDRILKNHKKNPEKHPQYNDEWKKFWNKRYKELQAESKDVSTYDFKPEWIEYWNKRMIEIHVEEVKTKKDALKKRLGLIDDPTPISFKIQPKRKFGVSKDSPQDSKVLPTAAQPDIDSEIIVIDDRDDESKGSKRSRSPWEDDVPIGRIGRKSREKSRSIERDYKSKSRDRDYRSKSRDRDYKSRSPLSYKSRSRSPRYRRSYSRSPERRYYRDDDYRPPKERIRIVKGLPWERERRHYGRNEIPPYYKPPPSVMRDVTREPVRTPPPVIPPPPVEPEDDSEVNVVAVLRLLTALEEKLGSLGPKVIDLLAQALAMEKNEANSSETLLDNEVNCVLFETVKEKLKGQLLAGLVDIVQERAFKNAIKKTASLIHLAGERKKERERAKPNVSPLKVPGVGTVDKAAIARQIANALVAQGKTDVTQTELEQLINAVVGMAEASKNSGKPITTANFLEQINKGIKEEPPTSSNSKSSTTMSITSTVKIKEEEIEVIKDKPKSDSNGNMESLSDSDLQTLLQNFKDLSTEEQHGLINYLKKLEAIEPDRVERLRKFVNLGGSGGSSSNKEEEKKGRESPFSNRTGSVNPTADEKTEDIKPSAMEPQKLFTHIDSDDDDYSFEDVVKVATKNVKAREEEKKLVAESIKLERKTAEENLESTKSIISNIMSNINKPMDLLGLGIGNSSTKQPAIDLTSPDFAKTIKDLPVNFSSLANIVGSVQNMTKTAQQQQHQQQQQNFEPSLWGQSSNYNRQMEFQSNRPNVTYPINNKGPGYYGGGFEQQPQSQQEEPLQGFGNGRYSQNDNRRFGNPSQQQPPQQQPHFNQYPNRNNSNYRW